MAVLAARILVLSLTISPSAACTSHALDVQPSSDPQTTTRPGDVRVIDKAHLEQLRNAGTHDIRGPLGEVTGAAPCPSGNVDEPCMEAARQRLRESAAARGANLVVIVRSAVAQSFPPQYSATGELYEMTARR
jgi:hypothetical protein